MFAAFQTQFQLILRSIWSYILDLDIGLMAVRSGSHREGVPETCDSVISGGAQRQILH